MRENETLRHHSWQRSYPIVPHSWNSDGTREYRLTFDDGQHIFFTPEKVYWPEVTRSVELWERIQRENYA